MTLAQSAGAQVWLLTQPYLDVPAFSGPDEASRRLEGGYRKGHREHTEIVKSLASEMGVGLVWPVARKPVNVSKSKVRQTR